MTIDTPCDRRITTLSPVEPRSLLGCVVHDEFDAVGVFVGKLLAPTEN